MSERFEELKLIAEDAEVVDTDKVGVDDPVIQSLYEMLFNVAGSIPSNIPTYEAAQRILDVVEQGDPPEKISTDDLESVFRAAGKSFIRIVLE